MPSTVFRVSSKMYWLLLLIILLSSFVMRLWLVPHGRTEVQVPDENSDLSTAVRLAEGTIPERHVRLHRSLIAYVDAVTVSGLFAYSYMTGEVASVEDFRDYYFLERGDFTLATRIFMSILITFAILFTALSGRYLGDHIGLLAALLLALNSFFVFSSLYALPDTLVIFSVALFLWLTIRAWYLQRKRDFFGAGVALGFLMLSKFSATSMAVCIVIAYTPLRWQEREALAAFVVGFVLGSVLFNPLAYVYPRDLVYELERMAKFMYQESPPLGDRLNIIQSHVEEMIMVVWRWQFPASLLGIIAAIRYRKSIPYWIILSVFVVFFVTISNVTTGAYKILYWTPFLAPMALVSAIGLGALIDWTTTRNQWGYAVGAVVIGAILVGQLADTGEVMARMSRDDTRELAAAYIRETIPEGSSILIGSTTSYTAPLQRNAKSVQRAKRLGATVLESWQKWIELPPEDRPWPSYNLYGPEMQVRIDSFDDVWQLIEEEHIEYVVEADFGCLSDAAQPSSDNSLLFPPVNAEMRNTWELVKVFSPFKSGDCVTALDTRFALVFGSDHEKQERLGPHIRIYRTSVSGN
jgi:hypothetical protein